MTLDLAAAEQEAHAVYKKHAFAGHAEEDASRCDFEACRLASTVLALVAEVKRLQLVLDRDGTGLAQGLAAIVKRVRSGWWITEGRGSYEWDDDRYRDETRIVLEEVQELAQTALRESGKRAAANAASIADVIRERDQLRGAVATAGARERELCAKDECLYCRLSGDGHDFHPTPSRIDEQWRHYSTRGDRPPVTCMAWGIHERAYQETSRAAAAGTEGADG